ncbi:MAG: hypothetical protein KDA22_02750 [Phycisphaerales bacterium]|nr:hypothetical protein [Phycisphaerales bacterium]
MPARRRVVITGLGPISALGPGVEPLWTALDSGRTALGRIRRFDPSGFRCRIGGELPAEAFDVRSVVPKSYRKATKVMARDIELAVGAAAAAVADAGLATRGTDADAAPTIDPSRMGCHIGAGLIAAETDELTSALATSRGADGSFDIGDWGVNGMTKLTPLWMLKYLPNMLSCHVTIIHDCQGPSNTITCAEASSGLSLGESMRVIERGDADACLSGGAESKLHLMGMLRQHFAERLVTEGDDAAQVAAVRPFDPETGGSALGEGGGILVLEAAESAQARGRTPIAELAGFAASQNECPDTVGLVPPPHGASIAACIDHALADAGVSAADVDAIVPFGSGIAATDVAEAAAIRSVFGARAAAIPIMTVVPFVGNCCAGSGALAAIVAAKAIHAQRLPARLNSVSTPGLDAVARPATDAVLRHVLVVSTSFGGQNAALVLRRST